MLILISGDGNGAGKTTLADRLPGQRLSLADGIREELQEEYPDYNWFDKTQEGKNKLVKNTGLTIRQMLIQRGEQRREQDEYYWAKKAMSSINIILRNNEANDIVIDDLRRLNEKEYLESYSEYLVTHIHIEHADAVKEPEYDNDKLKLAADYIIRRGASS